MHLTWFISSSEKATMMINPTEHLKQVFLLMFWNLAGLAIKRSLAKDNVNIEVLKALPIGRRFNTYLATSGNSKNYVVSWSWNTFVKTLVVNIWIVPSSWRTRKSMQSPVMIVCWVLFRRKTWMIAQDEKDSIEHTTSTISVYKCGVCGLNITKQL